MSARYDTISFLTDYGTTDEAVGVVKSVIRTIAPEVGVVDISHDVPPFDVRAGSLMLARSANYLAPGVVLAVVDPGVGTSRRAIAVEVGDGESVLVGPDNGLLAPIVQHVGGALRVVELRNPAFHLDRSGVGVTFAGRDVFGPVAAHVAHGVDLDELGPRLDPADLVPAVIPFAVERDGAVEGDVLHVDRYGNVHTNVSPEMIERFQGALRLQTRQRSFTVSVAQTFGDVARDAAVCLVDEVGMVSFAVNQNSAAMVFELHVGDAITISAVE